MSTKPPEFQQYGPKAWAWRLRKREHLCERLSMAQRQMWREALKRELEFEKREKA